MSEAEPLGYGDIMFIYACGDRVTLKTAVWVGRTYLKQGTSGNVTRTVYKIKEGEKERMDSCRVEFDCGAVVDFTDASYLERTSRAPDPPEKAETPSPKRTTWLGEARNLLDSLGMAWTNEHYVDIVTRALSAVHNHGVMMGEMKAREEAKGSR